MKKNDEQRQKKILIFCTIVLISIDQITKIIMYRQNNIIGNMDKSSRGYYIALSLIILISIIRYVLNDNRFIKFDTRLVLSFAIAGLIGNVIDRIWLGYVINFIKINELININLSYIYIFIAWIGMAIILTKNSMKILKDRKIKKGIRDEDKNNTNK